MRTYGKPLPPFPIDDLVASLVEALKIRGDSRALTALVEGECRLVLWDNDFEVDT